MAALAILLVFQVDSVQNFTWQQQLRYYWDMELDDCLIRHSDAKIRYGYEYMGATRCSSRILRVHSLLSSVLSRLIIILAGGRRIDHLYKVPYVLNMYVLLL